MKEVELSIEKIKFDDSHKRRSQRRQSGIVPRHVQDLVCSIKATIGAQLFDKSTKKTHTLISR